MASNTQIDFMEEIFTGMLTGSHSCQNFFVALHNTFVHGENLESAELPVTEDELKELFIHLEALIAVSKKIDGTV